MTRCSRPRTSRCRRTWITWCCKAMPTCRATGTIWRTRCTAIPANALSANVENLVLQGSADLQGYGNGLANAIYGNSGNNLIDGGTGADMMFGGAGNDAYFIDDAGDAVFENPDEGNDAVF